MKTQKGVTLTSLAIYITMVLIIIGTLAVISGTLQSNIKEIYTEGTNNAEIDKFNIYFLKEVKKQGNEISEISDNEILFSLGNKYTYNSNEKCIYLNDSIKIAEDIEKCSFSYNSNKTENEKTIITVTIKSINGEEKDINYVLNSDNYSQVYENEEDYLYEKPLPGENEEDNEDNIYESILPEEYQEIEYIESTGTQYINTGLIGKPGYTCETTVAFTKLSTGAYQYFTGYAYTGSADRTYHIRINNTTDHLGYTYGSNAHSRLTTLEEDRFYDIKSVMKVNKQELWLDGTKIYSTNYGELAYDEENPVYIYMFVSQYVESINGICNAKCKEAKWYDENDNLVRHFIPCYRKSDNVMGLYDLVTETLYTNQGSGEFIGGPSL